MSLEQKIEELTAAVIALTAVIRAEAGNYVIGEPMPAADVPPEVPKAEKVRKTKAEEPAPGLKDKPAAVDYDAMAKAFKDYIGSQGRDAAVELLATFEAKTLKDVPEAKWPLMMKAIS
jgi:hypothetical protein